jgi:sec-independent protein translocase protein TatA
MFGFGIIEIIIVLIIIIVLFGASRLPEIGRGIGEAIKNFKKSISEPPGTDGVPKKKTDKEK